MGEMGEKRHEAPVEVRSVLELVIENVGCGPLDDEADVEVDAFSAPTTDTTLCSSARTFLSLWPRSSVPRSGTGTSTHRGSTSVRRSRVLARPILTGVDEMAVGTSTSAGRRSLSSKFSIDGPDGQRWISMASTWVVLACGAQSVEEFGLGEEATVKVAVRL